MAKLPPLALQQFFDDNGDPLSGGKVYTYEAGTTTNKVTYTTSEETASHTNPVILDAAGRPTNGDIWLDSGAYKLRLFNSADVFVRDVDNVIADAGGDPVSYDISTNTNINTTYKNAVIYAEAAITLSLLPAGDADDGFQFTVKNNSSGDVIIDPDAAELINGGATFTLVQGATVIVSCDGTSWQTLGANLSLGSDNTFTGDNSFTGSTTLDDATFNGLVNNPDNGELTIASGVISITGNNHTIDTEGDAASDDLVTINGFVDGAILNIRIEDDARPITLKTTGNIVTPDGEDYLLSSVNESVALLYDAGLVKWRVLTPAAAQAIVVQSVNTPFTVSLTGTTSIPVDDTIPQNTEGTEFMTQAITPTDAANLLKIEVVFNVAQTGNASKTTVALFQDSTADAINAVGNGNSPSNSLYCITFTHWMTAGTTSETTFKVRAGSQASETLTFNGASGSRLFGGAMASSMTITEYTS